MNRERLVYLTPHTQTVMHSFDRDAVYVVGGIVDRSSSEPLSLAKAKRQGLKTARLPLEKYLTWGASSGKCLTLNAVLSILLELKMSGDWRRALLHVPQRKLKTEAEILKEENFRMEVIPFFQSFSHRRSSPRCYSRCLAVPREPTFRNGLLIDSVDVVAVFLLISLQKLQKRHASGKVHQPPKKSGAQRRPFLPFNVTDAWK